MERRSAGAVAVDLGASSARFAVGWLQEGAIHFELLDRRAHAPRRRDGRDRWDLDLLLGICRDAEAAALARFDTATMGICSWGVDNGFVDASGSVLAEPVAYRDTSHDAEFERLASSRSRLFELTGIQHQPFNTVYQLVARGREHPEWTESTKWMILPDLLTFLMGGAVGHESTQASTTQLMGLDGTWSDEAFQLTGWPVPDRQPELPGRVVGQTTGGVGLVRVGSHDTASAVCGLGTLTEHDAFLNTGTWALLGAIIDEPRATLEFEAGGWTNERTVDGRVRLLKNIPGFYIVNRLHEELKMNSSVAEWIASMDESFGGRFNYFSETCYNPPSMLQAVDQLWDEKPSTPEQYAAGVIGSLVEATAPQPAALAALLGRTIDRVRVSGGASQSARLCQALATASGLTIEAGPVEATVLGNLGMQFVAQGQIGLDELPGTIDRSIDRQIYRP